MCFATYEKAFKCFLYWNSCGKKEFMFSWRRWVFWSNTTDCSPGLLTETCAKVEPSSCCLCTLFQLSAKWSYPTLCLDVDPIQATLYLNGRNLKLLDMKSRLTRIQWKLKHFAATHWISNIVVWKTSDFLRKCTLLASFEAWCFFHLRASQNQTYETPCSHLFIDSVGLGKWASKRVSVSQITQPVSWWS